VIQKPRVLFLCTANSCRSQMAEGWLRHLAGRELESLSAGTHPTRPNPLMVQVMAELGIDVSRQTSKSIEAFLAYPPDLAITVCSTTLASCPGLPGRALLSWPFEDPSALRGNELEVLRAFRATRDAIGERLRAWLAAGSPGLPRPATSAAPKGRG
jgi:arsenate reductase